MDQSKFGFPSIAIVDDGRPADAVSERLPATQKSGGNGRGPDDGGSHAKVVIVGSGPAGLTAAIYSARANLEPIVIGGYAPGGQVVITSDVGDFPGVPC